MLKRRFKKYILILSMLVVSGCVLLFIYMTLFRWADYARCIPSAAEKVGAPPTMYGVEHYILTTATPGMEREEVMRVLEKLGPVQLRYQDVSDSTDEIRDTVFVKSCMHPLNNLEIYAFYDSEGKLISISLLNVLE